MSYRSSGVDVEKGDELVSWLQKEDEPASKELAVHKSRVASGIGGFAALYRLDFLKSMTSPLLVTSTDGVGTKVLIAAKYQKLEKIGYDLVGMCVNDLLCCGATPLQFLDYYAVGKLDLLQAQAFLTGVKAACNESNMILIGGETAEMPGVYQRNDFDCAGFAVGIVDEPKILGPTKVKKGDRVIGVESSGFHSNGYSLLRKVFEKDMDDWVDSLLIPTRLYVKLMEQLKVVVEEHKLDLHAVAHITGSGIENVPRILPENLAWKMQNWQWPSAFIEVQHRAQMTKLEMLKTLNCGVGLVLVVSEQSFIATQNVVHSFGYKSFDLGFITDRIANEEIVLPAELGS